MRTAADEEEVTTVVSSLTLEMSIDDFNLQQAVYVAAIEQVQAHVA